MAAAILGAVLLVPAAAMAGDDDAPDSLNLMTVGLAVGSAELGDVGGTAVGLHLDLGHSFGAFHVQAEYMLGGFTENQYAADSQHRGAIIQRVGALGRWNGLDKSFGYDHQFRVDVWLEAGIAREFWQWTEGGKLDRDVYTLGFGTGFLGNVGSRHKRKWLGTYYDFRFTIADSPYTGKKEAIVGCAGPCEEPTKPVPIDFGFLFVLGFNFGR